MMNSSGKKDEARFTIRFNPADPRHQIAMEVLASAGRRKASIIADAICDYLVRHSPNGNLDQLADIGQVVRNKTTLQDADSAVIEDDNGSSTAIPIDENMRNAVLSGLSMFGG